MPQSRIGAFTTMLKDQPDNEMIWQGLPNEYMEMENWPAAIEALRNDVRIKPGYTSVYQMLGAALLKREGSEEARREWMEGVEAANRTGAEGPAAYGSAARRLDRRGQAEVLRIIAAPKSKYALAPPQKEKALAAVG
jgi:tetratricopeptide (TPR) repeat protein